MHGATVTDAPGPLRRLVLPVERFLATESAGGMILIGVAVVAFVWANSPWQQAYTALRELPVVVGVGNWGLAKPLASWVKDLLMAIFFFLVGLEIKREMVVGELAGWKRAGLPALGAIGGMLGPALIYAALNAGTPYAPGWGIPMATDIAFAVGVLALLGSRVPAQLKIFLLALAIVDDLGAVIVIAVFYTADLSFGSLAASLAVWLILVAYGRAGGGRPAVYVVVGAVVWYLMLKSGVHGTIAGVLCAMTVPIRHRPETVPLAELLPDTPANGAALERREVQLQALEDAIDRTQSPLHAFEHGLAPWVAFGIMPVFALLNAGVNVTGGGTAFSTATWGAGLGLLLGKPLGIVGLVWLAERLRLVERPRGVSWTALVGVGLLGGIGFTMSLFVAGLAFPDPGMLDEAKLGVLLGSVAAAVSGLLLLRASLTAPAAVRPSPAG